LYTNYTTLTTSSSFSCCTCFKDSDSLSSISNDSYEKFKQHQRKDGWETYDMVVLTTGLARNEAKAVEEILIYSFAFEAYGEASSNVLRAGTEFLNRRFEIAEKNYHKFQKEMERANQIIYRGQNPQNFIGIE